MRRFYALITLVGLLGVGVGCNHTAGVCDCHVEAVHPWVPPPIIPACQAVQPEPVKVMPKADL